MKHTPGPWSISEHTQGIIVGREPKRTSTLVREEIAKVIGGVTDDEHDANCHLIAATPEMFDELKLIADLYHQWIADDSGTGHPRVSYYASGKERREDRFAGISLTREQVLRIVALVAKAEGRTS